MDKVWNITKEQTEDLNNKLLDRVVQENLRLKQENEILKSKIVQYEKQPGQCDISEEYRTEIERWDDNPIGGFHDD